VTLNVQSLSVPKARKPLGITTFIDYEGKDGNLDLKGFGDGKRYFFWLKEGKPDPQAVHVGFGAKDHSEVDAFYKAALATGGKSEKSPQPLSRILSRLLCDLGA
jgi:hypothetical protein